MTSVSSRKKIKAGSISTVLTQALVSEDTETMEWILNQKDHALIVQTLQDLQDPKQQGTLFRLILNKLQQED